MQERVDNLQALNSLGALLTLARGNGFSKLFGSSSKVDAVEQVADSLCAHAALEVVGIVQAHLAIQGFVGYELLGLDLQESLQSLRTQGLALVELLVDVSDFLFDFLGGRVVLKGELADFVFDKRGSVICQATAAKDHGAHNVGSPVTVLVPLVAVNGKADLVIALE